MKKTINRKSYNTEYDAEFVCKYVSVIDGWAREQDFLYRKKSTGEYFLYKKWSSWNDGWDIVLVNDKKAAGDKTWGDAHWGETEVYQASAGYKFSKYDGRELSADKKGKVVYHKVSFRIVNNDYDRKSKDSWGGYKYSASIVLPAEDKKVAKDTVKKFLDRAVELKGRLDPVMKDGVFIGVSDHNKDVMKTFYGMVDTFNEEMCF